MGKLTFVAGAAVGYVLGARAGRKRYEQIKGQATRLWRSQPVQERVGSATDTVKQQAAPFVTEKLGEAVKAVGQQMRQSSLPGRGEQLPETIHRGTDGQLHADNTGLGPGGDRLP
jgi:hypothetical protein